MARKKNIFLPAKTLDFLDIYVHSYIIIVINSRALTGQCFVVSRPLSGWKG